MSNTTKIFMTVLLVLAAGAGPGPARAAEQKPPVQVAVSVYNTEPAFMRQWLADLNRHPAVLDGRAKLHVFNCTGSHAVQHMHFETISTMRYDAVIVVANDFRASRNLAGLLGDAGIPVVASCAQTDADDLYAFIGPDDVRAGFLTAESVAEALNGRGDVAVLRGPPDQGATQHRDAGIAEALGRYPGISEIRVVPANWSRAEAMQVVQGLLDRNLHIDGIIAENDEMALGALEVLKRNGVEGVPAASIDGLPDAVDAVRRGELLQTLRQDSALQAQGALDLALQAVLGDDCTPESPAWTDQILTQWKAGGKSGTRRRYSIPWEVITKDTGRTPASPPASQHESRVPSP